MSENDPPTSLRTSRSTEDLSAESIHTVNRVETLESAVVNVDPSLLVTLDEDDPENVYTQLSTGHKWFLTAIVCFTFFQITANSSTYTNAMDPIMERMECGKVVATLGISFFILGLGAGPMIFAPLSEYYGRRPIYVVGLALYVIFQLPVCLATNIQTMLIGRFLSAFFSSSFAAVSGGTITDIFDKQKEHEMLVLAMSTFSLSPFFGPSIGPLISGFIVQHSNWRWVFWVMLIWSGVLFVVVLLFSKETYGPVLTEQKVRRLRGDPEQPNIFVRIFASGKEVDERGELEKQNYTCALMELKKRQSLWKNIMINCERPFGLLAKDPMVALVCLYSGLLLAIVYSFFVAFPLVFGNIYNFDVQFIGMSFLPLCVGQIVATYGSIPLVRRLTVMFNEKRVAAGKAPGTPEMKLIPMMIGCFLCPIGLFWFGWTCYESIHWIVPMIGSAFFGAGTVLVFSGTFGFLVDGYRLYAASAMAANACVRCILSSAFPLFTRQMYQNWSYHWATTLLGLVTCVMIPIPFAFYIHGEKLRSKSPYAWN